MIRRPRFRKMLSDLWGNKLRSLLVIASISIGLFALGVIANMYAVMSEDMRIGFAAANPANIQLRGGPFTEMTLDQVEDVPGVEQVQGTVQFTERLRLAPGEYEQIGLQTMPDADRAGLNQVVLVEGQWPPGEREVVLEQYKFEDAQAEIGDLITIEMDDGRLRELKLVGVVNDQTLGAYDTGPGFFLSPIQGYITADTAEWLGQLPEGNYNTIYAAIAGDRGDSPAIQAVADRIRDDLEDSGLTVVNVLTRSAFDHPNRVYIDALIGVLVLLGFFIIFLSVFLITNTLQALMKQQVQQIGIMKSLGGRRRQVIAIYLGLIVIFGLLAALVSIPLSAQVAFSRVGDLAGEVNFIFRGPRVFPWVVALQFGLAILAPVLAALIPIIQGSRISVQQALSGIQPKAGEQTGWLTRQVTQVRRLPRPLLITIRNTFRQRWRVILTLVTLSLGGGIFIAAFNVQVSMDQYIERVSRYFLADVNVSLARSYRIERVEQALQDVPGIASVEAWAAAGAELVNADGSAGEAAQILAPPADSTLVDPVLLSGRWIVPGDRNAIAVNERFLTRYPDLQPGDPLVLRINGDDTEWVVVGIFQLVGNSGGFIGYTNYEHLSEVLDQPNRAAVFRVVADQPGLTLAQQTDLGSRIDAALDASGIRVQEIEAGESLSSLSADGFSILTAFLLFLAGLTALVGSIGLAGTMSMNVLERTREIGIMRAIGATDGILLRMVILEGMLIGLLSWVIGSLLAFPISKLLSDSITQAIFGAPSTLGVTATGFVIWLAAVFALSVAASVLPARSASRLTIREVLAYE